MDLMSMLAAQYPGQYSKYSSNPDADRRYREMALGGQANRAEDQRRLDEAKRQREFESNPYNIQESRGGADMSPLGKGLRGAGNVSEQSMKMFQDVQKNTQKNYASMGQSESPYQDLLSRLYKLFDSGEY